MPHQIDTIRDSDGGYRITINHPDGTYTMISTDDIDSRVLLILDLATEGELWAR